MGNTFKHTVSIAALSALFITGCSDSVLLQNESSATSDMSSSSYIGPVEAPSSSLDTISQDNSDESSEGGKNRGESSESVESEESSNNEERSSDTASEDSSSGGKGGKSDVGEKLFDGESAYIFDDDAAVRTFKILIKQEALDRINALPKEEIYEYADFVFEGDTVRDVQVRYKGSAGAWYPCTNDPETGSPYPPGPNSCLKLSTKVKFNTEDEPDRKFFGLKKLQFHHMHHYDSQLRERLVYWFHNAMGNPAPRAVHARVEINGTLTGLYALVEQIDGRFTRERWEDGEGNIYKNNTVLPEGELSDDATLFEVLKTNEDEDPVYTIWQTFEEELDAAEDVDEITGVIEKWMDVPLMVQTVVTSIAMGHWDSPFLRKEHTNHNSYWYSDTTEQKLYSLPWDVDNAFISLSGRTGEWAKGYLTVSDVADAFACSSPVPNKLQGHWLCFPGEIKSALDKLIDEVFPQVWDQIDKWEAQIDGVTKEVIETHGTEQKFPKGPLKMKQWRDGVADLKDALEKSKQIAEDWRSGL
ncbi:MAG: CotH kinase family protein [Reichenbachiella sp.]